MVQVNQPHYGIQFLDSNGVVFCKLDEISIWFNYEVYNEPSVLADLMFDSFEELWLRSFDWEANLNRNIELKIGDETVCVISRNDIWFSDEIIVPDFISQRTIDILRQRWYDTSSKE